MAAPSMGDRQNISKLYTTGPINYRDASGDVWKNPPTAISTPARGSSSLDHSHSYGQNPWSRSIMTSNPRQKKIGNPTAGTTIIAARATKRRKTETESSYFSLGKGTHTTSKRPLIPSEITFVDDEEEDLGTPLTTDELDIIELDPPHYPTKTKSSLSTLRARRNQLDTGKAIPSLSVLSTNSGSRVVKDGPATRRLENDLDARDQESDPIRGFSEDPEPPSQQLDMPRKGIVKENISRFEPPRNTEGSNGPRVDLRRHQGSTSKLSIKNRMKLKASESSQRDLFGTTPSFPNSSRSTAPRVPIKEWFLGIEHKNSDGSYYISWDKSTVTFKLERSPPVVQFNVDTDIESIQYFEYKPARRVKNPTIVMKTYPPVKNRHQRNSEHFTMGDKYAKGAIVVKVDTSHGGWDKSYDAFIHWIKSHVSQKSVLTDRAAALAWEAAERNNELGVISANRTKRQNLVEEVQLDEQPNSLKRPASDDADALDQWTPPPAEDVVNNSSDRHSTSTSNSRAATRPPSSRNSNAESPNILCPSRRSTRLKERFPEADLDEVILCYPQGVSGAVNITNADFRRLQPGEFLNDTLIEFGLKLWLRKLEESNPKVANQVHVFSSFFYKKLNQKDIKEGYESVRKWTSKLDVFSKKFLIVPINENLHWYLAIVYQPEFVLLPPSPPPSPPPPKETRHRAHLAEMREASAIAPEANIGLPLPGEVLEQETSSEGVVERDLCQFETSCSLTTPSENSSTTMYALSAVGDTTTDEQDPPEDPSFTEMDVDNNIQHRVASRKRYLPVSDYRQASSSNSSAHDVNMIDISSPSWQPEEKHPSRLFDDDQDVEHASHSIAVAPSHFYEGSKKAKGKQKVIPQPQSYPIEVEDDDREEVAISSSPSTPRTYIFTMDSLGGVHRAAINKLKKYLQLEAEDKRKLSETSEAHGKQAIVPVQPNFCDCGLYLLHFAETFVNNPDKYCRIIMSTRSKIASDVRREDWEDAKTAGMRERMMEAISRLSAVWKKERAEREEARKNDAAGPTEVLDSSDDEVDIVDVTPTVVTEKGKGKGKGKGSPVKKKAARIRSG